MTEFDLKRMFPSAGRDFLLANTDTPAPVRPKNTCGALPLLAKTNPVAAAYVAKNGISDEVDNGHCPSRAIPDARSTIKFTIPVEPRPVQSGKKIGINRKTGGRMIYTDKKAEQYYKDVINASIPYLPEFPLDGPIHVSYGFFINRPKRLYRKTDPREPIWCPDCKDSDNLIKGTQDALTKAGFWNSDAQIVILEATKMYSAKGEFGSIHISIQKI